MAKRNEGKEEEKKQDDSQQDNPSGGAGSQNSDPPDNKTNALIEAAARIPTTRPLGARKTDKALYFNSDGTFHYTSESKTVPGIWVFDYIPTLGVSTGIGSTLNRASNYEFNAIRAKISGNRPYAASDHMIYRIAVESLRDLYTYAVRIYRTLPTVQALNLYRPQHIFTAMGLDYDDYLANAGQLYFWLHKQRNALLPFPTVPIGTIYDRHQLFNSAYFTDGEPESAQTYILNQKAFWSYEVVDQVKGLTPRHLGTKFQDLVDLWDSMLNALSNSTDAYIIAADIRRAFEDRVITDLVPPADIEENIDSMYVKLDPALLTIMNATILGQNDMASPTRDNYLKAFRIYDDQDILKCTPNIQGYVKTSGLSQCGVVMVPANYNHINAVESCPSPDTIATMMRMKLEVHATPTRVEVRSMSTEVIMNSRILIIDPNEIAGYKSYYVSSLMLVDADIDPVLTSEYISELMSVISAFDWHPPVTFANAQIIGEGSDINFTPMTEDTHVFTIEDIQNYVVVSDENTRNIHEAVLLTEFGF